jgi:hypothetical protein
MFRRPPRPGRILQALQPLVCEVAPPLPHSHLWDPECPCDLLIGLPARGGQYNAAPKRQGLRRGR